VGFGVEGGEGSRTEGREELKLGLGEGSAVEGGEGSEGAKNEGWKGEEEGLKGGRGSSTINANINININERSEVDDEKLI
jgi:hypothetical protein